MSEIVAADQLKSIVQRVERLEGEISDLNADKSEIYKEARANGFDVKAIKKVISKRKLDESKRDEEDAVFDTYWDAVHGSGLVHAPAREKIEQFSPITGEFVDDTGTPSVGSLQATDTSLTTRAPFQQSVVVDERPPSLVHTNSPEVATEETAPHEVADLNSVESISPQASATTGSSAANIGECPDEEVKTDRLNTDQGRGLVNISTAHKPLRPLCLRPEACGGYGDKTCHSCTVAARTTGEAA
ncbi:DUF2312 domain-containing protein [Rhizobium sp. K1/93]|nr:DUF2312 domain-containing protein [Rhizobium sp. L58/93]QXZ87049.1 DUF2312 domain-containing protein [Rhizobium sp. K1/93]QXZ92917.1 DUF2312 domain-containing protein [Rhizobium sp. K15/93]